MSFEVLVFVVASIPGVLFLRNLMLYRRLPRDGSARRAGVSLLIPARNEERAIGAALRSALASRGVDVEVLVLDDGSTDATAGIVRSVAGEDERVRLLPGPPLPAGWCGKQHACSVLARHARHEVLCFVDADVRLAPDALARMAARLEGSGAALISGFPRQQTGTFLEKLLIPLIHFVLLGYLPMDGMRHTRMRGFAAGCGQLMMTRRDAYQTAGGHAAIRETLHDGIRLPAAYRAAGLRTDLFDATDVATCRMYTSARDTWNGLAKNAVEGMGAPARILVFSFLLAVGQIVPFALLIAGEVSEWTAGAAALGWLPRVLGVWRFGQPVLGAVLHPAGVAVLLAIQWYALTRSVLGRPAGWKGRSYRAAAGPV